MSRLKAREARFRGNDTGQGHKWQTREGCGTSVISHSRLLAGRSEWPDRPSPKFCKSPTVFAVGDLGPVVGDDSVEDAVDGHGAVVFSTWRKYSGNVFAVFGGSSIKTADFQ